MVVEVLCELFTDFHCQSPLLLVFPRRCSLLRHEARPVCEKVLDSSLRNYHHLSVLN
jgi:hypothetical protein